MLKFKTNRTKGSSKLIKESFGYNSTTLHAIFAVGLTGDFKNEYFAEI